MLLAPGVSCPIAGLIDVNTGIVVVTEKKKEI